MPSGFASRLIDTARFERIIVLDDSLSMQVNTGGESAMKQAVDALVDIVQALPHNDSDDTLTLLLTSQPGTPQVNAVRDNIAESANDLADRFKDLAASSRTAEPE